MTALYTYSLNNMWVFFFFFRSGLCKLWSIPDCSLIRTLRGEVVNQIFVNQSVHNDNLAMLSDKYA